MTFKSLLPFLLLFFALAELPAQEPDILEDFKDPAREYSIVPFWSWNGTLEKAELERQIDLMIEKGVYGAFMHARAGINYGETPYFSDGWWEAVDATVRHAERTGFKAWLYDEDKWPSGSAGGRTIAMDPEEFVKKGLHYEIIRLSGPAEYRLDRSGETRIFAVKMTGEEDFERSSQVNLTDMDAGNWEVPEGDWSVIRFEVIADSREAPVTHIDYLDSNAVAAFIEITNDEYYKRFGEHFGKTIPGIFFDEIFFNNAIFWDDDPGRILSWTDDFAESFEKRKGYDILDELPSLVLGSEAGETINWDYFEELTYRYDNAWFKPYSEWCDKHGIMLTGHTMEEFHAFLYEGDYMKTIGRLQMPGTDNEDFRYNYPRYLKWFKPRQLSSVSSIYGKKYATVEAMGGGGYMITPEEYRYGMARMAVCGLNFIIPHFFHYSTENIQAYTDWPPSWFFRNPYWKYFKPLADYGRRITYMNTIGTPVRHVAILFPLSEQWAGGQRGDVDDRTYMQIQEDLLNNHIEFDLVNEDAFNRAKTEGGLLRLHEAAYRVLILPSITSLTLETALKIDEFCRSGGVVISAGRIPVRSIKGKDAEVRNLMNGIFGFPPELAGKYYDVDPVSFKPYTSHGAGKGTAYYTKTLSPLPDLLNEHINPEIELIEGSRTAIRYHQRRQGDKTWYLLMNEEKVDNSFLMEFPDYGVPYFMDPETGESEKVRDYLQVSGRLQIPVHLGPWEGRYVSFIPGKDTAPEVMLASTNLQEARLSTTGNEIMLTAWAGPAENHYARLERQDGSSRKFSLPSIQVPEPHNLEGSWDFRLAQHSLDRAWTESVRDDTLEIPVMRFFADHEGRLKPGDDFPDTDFPLVKIRDQFSDLRGTERYLDGWNASRIIYYDLGNHFPQIGGQDVVFIKTFSLEKVPRQAGFSITADPGYTLWVNGKKVGGDSRLETVETYDISDFLVEGRNEILVEVEKHMGLLAEGSIGDGKRMVYLHTNDSWEVEFNGIRHAAIVHSKPPLGSWDASRIGLREISFPLVCWYSKEIPAGSRELILPERSGDFTFYIEGRELEVKGNSIVLPGTVENGSTKLLVRAVLEKGDRGLLEPLRAVCTGISTELVPWEKMGMEWYTGRAVYSKEFDIPEGWQSGDLKIMLDPGSVRWFAEIWINGELAKQGPWGDYSTDIGEYLKEGKNRVSIVVSNLKANEAFYAMPDGIADDVRNRWWQQGATLREKERLESGLLGPVRLIPYRRVEEKLATW